MASSSEAAVYRTATWRATRWVNYLQPWKARLYDEFGRHDLALQGERTVFDREGAKHTERLELEAGAEDFRPMNGTSITS